MNVDLRDHCQPLLKISHSKEILIQGLVSLQIMEIHKLGLSIRDSWEFSEFMEMKLLFQENKFNPNN